MQQLVSLVLLTLVVGSVYAMAATGLVLTYKTSRVFNFAHGAVGMFFAYVFRQLWVEWDLPLPLALFVTVGLAAPAAGIVAERLLFRPLRTAPTALKVVVTVGLLISLLGLAATIWGEAGLFVPTIIPVRSFRIAGSVAIGSDQLVVLAIAAGTTAALAVALTRTRFGLWIRAVVDRSDLAELAAIPSHRVSQGAWAIGFATAALGGILLSPLIGLSTFTLTLLVVQAYAAALIGRLESLPMTFVGGLVIAGLEQSATLYLPRECAACQILKPSIPFLLMFALLAWAAGFPRGRLGRWVATAAVQEPAAPPPQPKSSRPSRAPRTFASGLLLLCVIAPLLSPRWLLRVEDALAVTGIFVSIAVLTGLSGQISLGHTAFVGTGAFVMGALAGRVPFPIALVAAGAATVPVGFLVALPAIRLQGIFLALLTFGYGLVASSLFSSALTNAAAGVEVARPSFASSDLGYLYVLVVIVVLLVFLAANLERSPTGRILAAIRDSERASLAIGISLPSYKHAVFALSAFMAGIAGAGLGGFQRVVTFIDFHIFFSLVWLAVAVIGGLGSVWGAPVAGLVWLLLGSFAPGSKGQILFGLGAIVLARTPRGIAGSAGAVLDALGRLSWFPRAAADRFARTTAEGTEVTSAPPRHA